MVCKAIFADFFNVKEVIVSNLLNIGGF
jgi:hypothetical protein